MKKIFLLILGCTVCVLARSQSRISTNNTIGWYTTTITAKVAKKVSLHGEYQWRRSELIKNWQQSLVRVGVNYSPRQELTFQVGYGFIETFPYGEYNLAGVGKAFPEHRVYEQVTVSNKVGKATLSHRLRLEQRWLGRFSSLEDKEPEYIFLNRVRYMPRLSIPIASKTFVALYDEILIGFGKNVGENVFDQNRIAAMLGYDVSKRFRIEGGFINQIVQLGREIDNKNVFQYNNGLILNTYIYF